MRKLIPSIAILAFTACSTPGSSRAVIERSDTRPSWATLSRVAYQEGDKMMFVGNFTADGDSRPDAVVLGASTRATASPLESITDDFVQQNGVEQDLRDSTAKFIISTLRRNPPRIAGLQVTGSYYERVEIRGSDGSLRTEIDAYSLAECPVADYNTAKQETLARLKGDPKIKQELNTIMAQQRDQTDEARKPASASPMEITQPLKSSKAAGPAQAESDSPESSAE